MRQGSTSVSGATTARTLRVTTEAVIPEVRKQHGSLPPFCLLVLIVLGCNAVHVIDINDRRSYQC